MNPRVLPISSEPVKGWYIDYDDAIEEVYYRDGCISHHFGIWARTSRSVYKEKVDALVALYVSRKSKLDKTWSELSEIINSLTVSDDIGITLSLINTAVQGQRENRQQDVHDAFLAKTYNHTPESVSSIQAAREDHTDYDEGC